MDTIDKAEERTVPEAEQEEAILTQIPELVLDKPLPNESLPELPDEIGRAHV